MKRAEIITRIIITLVIWVIVLYYINDSIIVSKLYQQLAFYLCIIFDLLYYCVLSAITYLHRNRKKLVQKIWSIGFILGALSTLGQALLSNYPTLFLLPIYLAIASLILLGVTLVKTRMEGKSSD